jgi:uncharacterized protein YuzE
MKVKYFADTDTVLLEFSENSSVETRELNENVYLDLDAQGMVVSLTIEHAQQATAMNEFSYQIIPAFTSAA